MKLDRIKSSAIIYSTGLIAISLLLILDISNIKSSFTFLPDWYDSYLWVNLIGKLFAVLLILKFRKIGVYSLIGLMILEFIVGSLIVRTDYSLMTQLFSGTIILAIFLSLVYWTVSTKWKSFK